uniref:ATP synthase CF0 B' chain subunit II n=1 Tax=Nitzschia sp. IriIs04 TaxID=1444690 RepID=A0A0S3QPK7_9STRA|nr:ATP synthase CF0 B' chain subunit II [Nitzschia sp. IriIs04]BAT70272.1 ATP synthase CF0 B' chain subunit II [Nitzschia sp. IriIs04]
MLSQGGIFDLNATILYVTFQFLLLMFLLNFFLYNPVQVILEERDIYIDLKYKISNTVLSEIKNLVFEYEKRLITFYKKNKKINFNIEKNILNKLKIELKILNFYIIHMFNLFIINTTIKTKIITNNIKYFNTNILNHIKYRFYLKKNASN